jgi:hypothetical protein
MHNFLLIETDDAPGNITEDNKNWSASAPDTHQHIEKIAGRDDFWG